MNKSILKISVCVLFLVFGGSCQTTSLSAFKAPVDSFKIQKLSESGITETTYKQGSVNEWPDVEFKKLDGLAVNSQKISFAVIGDTGCRLKESKSKSSYQKCNLPNQWPFTQIAQKIKNEKVDFIVHTGDYHYREQCTDASQCAKLTAHSGYGWGAWWDDFYGPAQDLFKKTPFLFVRGNHEDCHRAYQGFNPLAVKDKNFQAACEEFDEIQLIEIGDLVFINFDDSAFEDRKHLNDEARKEWVARFQKTLLRVQQLTEKKEIWLLTHMPVFGFFPNEEDAEPQAITENLSSVLKESGLLSKINYILSGHVHNQQIVLNQSGLKQFIVGNSGATLDPFGRQIMNENIITTTDTKNSFGYALFERQGFKNWNLTFKNVESEVQLACHLKDQKMNCEFKK